MWHFGIRKLDKDRLIITEEFYIGRKNGYSEIGILESYNIKELILMFKDILKILKKGKIKKTTKKDLLQETKDRLLSE
jgi:hypothetical protein